MTKGCNDEASKKMNRGERGITVCEGVSACVCVADVCTYVCVRVSSQDYSRTHTRACNRYYFIIFIIFLSFSTFNPLLPGEGEISLPHSRAIFSKLRNKDKDLFSFRNCKKLCKKAQNAIISLSFPFYVNWQPPENWQCIGERARREMAKRGFGNPQVVVYEWIRLSIVLPYADHLFSVTQTLLPRFCSIKVQEMVMCL